MSKFASLFEKYDKLFLFDTETTGLKYDKDQIIEFAAVIVEQKDGNALITKEYDELVTLREGTFVPQVIQNLTGISTEDIARHGIPKEQVCRDIAEMIEGRTLLLAYNAHFDLSFLYYFLREHGDPAILKGKDKLDLYTVYRDRRPYPHKLCNAIEAYGLSGQVVNSHRAVDDVIATVAVMEKMEEERADLECYVNLFGYNPKFGVDGKRIGSVTYKPQNIETYIPLYTL